MHPAKTQISLGIHWVWWVFAVHMREPSVLSYPLSAQQGLIRLCICVCWSESSVGTHHFVGFAMLWLKWQTNWPYLFCICADSNLRSENDENFLLCIWVLWPVRSISLILSRVNHLVGQKWEIPEKNTVNCSSTSPFRPTTFWGAKFSNNIDRTSVKLISHMRKITKLTKLKSDKN